MTFMLILKIRLQSELRRKIPKDMVSSWTKKKKSKKVIVKAT